MDYYPYFRVGKTKALEQFIISVYLYIPSSAKWLMFFQNRIIQKGKELTLDI